MNAERTGALSYWPSAGAVMGRHGELALASAISFVRFLGTQAHQCRRQGDAAGARYCALVALELAQAVVAAADWRRAAGAAPTAPAPVEARRAVTRDLKRKPDG